MPYDPKKYAQFLRNQQGLGASLGSPAGGAGGPPPGGWAVNRPQGTASGFSPAPTGEPIPLWEQIKSSLSNNPRGVHGRVLASAFPMVGAGIGAGATLMDGVPGDEIAGAGLGGAGGEGVRQLLGELTGQYTPTSPTEQAKDMGKSGASMAIGQGIGMGIKGLGNLAADGMDWVGTRMILPRAEVPVGAAQIPYDRMQRLKLRAPQVLSQQSTNEYTPSVLANDLRDQVNTGVDRSKKIWETTKDALNKKFGNARVVETAGLKGQMEKTLEKYGYDASTNMDKRAVQYFNNLIEDATSKGDMTVNDALNMTKRFNREIKFAKTRAVDPNYSGDEALLNDLKEQFYKRVDKADPRFGKARSIYSQTRQLERDAAGFLNSKDLPHALESADSKATTDLQLVHRLSQKFPEIDSTLEKLRDSIAGESFRRPIPNLFGQIYGKGMYYGGKAADALPLDVLGPTAGAPLDIYQRH